MTEYVGNFWCLTLPDDWGGHHEDGIETLYQNTGVGVLELISSKEDKTLSFDDLEFYASDNPDIEIALSSVELGTFKGYEIEYDLDGDYWRKWYLMAGNILLLVKYNCKTNEKHLEGEAVSQILQTLKTSP